MLCFIKIIATNTQLPAVGGAAAIHYAGFRGNIVINSSVVIFTRVRFLNIIAKSNEYFLGLCS